MRPNQPVLGIYLGDSDSQYRQILKGNNRGEDANWEELCSQLEDEKNFFKEQYQKLYQSYCEKREKLKEHKQYKKYIKQLENKVRILEHKLEEYERHPSREHHRVFGDHTNQIFQLKRKNEKLTKSLISKNEELEEVYFKLQQNVRHSSPFEKIQFGVPIDVIKERVLNNTAQKFEELKYHSLNAITNGLGRQNTHVPQIHSIQPAPTVIPQAVSSPRIVFPPSTTISIPPQFSIPSQMHLLSHHNPNTSPPKQAANLSVQQTVVPQFIIPHQDTQQKIVENKLPISNKIVHQTEVIPPSQAVEFHPITMKK